MKLLLSNLIRYLRKKKDLTQEELAELMDVSTLSISNMEHGKHFLSAKNLNKLITIFELEIQLKSLSLFLTSDSEKQKLLLQLATYSNKELEDITLLFQQQNK